ncbi:MAG TPA: hypothetical protein VLJ58_12405, partial [Ramlibacter sp.]|nr:hypothetical protein [Ramlibacter sp.]
LTHLHEGNVGREGTLTGADATIQLGEKTRLHAEVARSDRNTETGPAQGSAYLAEVRHDGGKVVANAYVRGQDGGFGLGQQAVAAGGTRRIGGDAGVKISDTLRLQTEAYRQENEVNDARRDVVQAQALWNEKGFSASAGVRAANEVDTTGRDISVRQVTGGGSIDLMEGRLTLRASTELDAGSRGGDSATFPNRLTLGADYKLTPLTSLFVQHEIARGSELKSDMTRLGLKTQPWRGAEAAASLGSQIGGTDSGRMFANLGLTQRWEINERWRADFSVDRGQTLRRPDENPFHEAQALPSGTLANPASVAAGIVTGNYTALSGGLAYKDKVWSANGRLEWRGADTETKINLTLGAQRTLDNGDAAAAGLAWIVVNGGTTPSRKMDVALSYAHRPLNDKLVWLDRLQYVHEERQDLAGKLLTRKLINNMNANWTPNRRTQVAFQYGAKYVLDTIDGRNFRGYTDLVGVEGRYDITAQWDIGLHAGMLHSWKTGTKDYHLGISVGHKLTDNSWLSVGYNHLGFSDSDFTGAEYRAKGLYLNLRVKFDQDSFDLNDRKKSQSSPKP